MIQPARPPLPHPALMLVTDSARLRGRQLDAVAREAVEGGVNIVQLRERALPTHDLIALGERVRDAITGRALLLVNGDLNAALALGADGVHLPGHGPSVAEARVRAGDGVLISRAVHSLEAAQRAERDGADALVLGTVFPSASHPHGRAIGLDGVRAVCGRVRIPVIGIGGVTAANAADVLCAGASGVAVIGAIFDPDDATVATAALREAIAAGTRV